MLEFPDIIQLAYEEIIFLRQFRMGLIQVKLTLSFDQFLLSSDLTVYNLPIVANTFIRKLTLPVFLRVFSSLYDELEIDLEL